MNYHPPINLLNAHLLGLTETGNAQCDEHLREKNLLAGIAQCQTHDRLLQRITQFVWLEDEKLEPVIFASTVAQRLLTWATEERRRRREVCPEGFEHLLD